MENLNQDQDLTSYSKLSTAVALALAGYSITEQQAKEQDTNGHTLITFRPYCQMLSEAQLEQAEYRYLCREYKFNFIDLPTKVQTFLKQKIGQNNGTDTDGVDTSDSTIDNDVDENDFDDSDSTDEHTVTRKELLEKAQQLGLKKKELTKLSDEDLLIRIKELDPTFGIDTDTNLDL